MTQQIEVDVNDTARRRDFLSHGLKEALSRLTSDRVASWGRMTGQEMVEHLLWAFELSTGKLVAACATPEEKQLRYKAFLHDNRPMPHGFENPLLTRGLPPLRYESLAAAVKALELEAAHFLSAAESESVLRTHPVFGPCSGDEWSRIHYKHAVHHCLQFGLIEVAGDTREPQKR